MKFMKTATILTLMAGCAFACLDVKRAEALNLLDLFRKKRPVMEWGQPLPGVAAPVQQEQAESAPRPLPRVKGPQYYTYKAEPLRRIDTAGLVDLVVTSSVGATSSLPQQANQGVRRFLADVAAYATADTAKAVEVFYANNKTFIWTTPTGPNPAAKAAIAVLQQAGTIGLDPQDYALAIPADDFDHADMEAREKELADFEIRLSAATLTYIADTVRGRIDPNKISGYHDFRRKPVNLEAKLRNMALSHDVAAYLNAQTPSGPEFEALKRELSALQSESDGTERIVIATGTRLKPGESNPELANIVAAIVKKASPSLRSAHEVTLSSYGNSADYTPELVALVEDFQRENGLTPDGIIGKASLRILSDGESAGSKIDKVRIAMEQARWLPADLGSRYVFINQPAFMVYYHDKGVEQFSMRVVVGSKKNQTFFFEDEIQTVEFNPYWGVPQSIIINEMLPRLRNDPGYLDRLGYQVEVAGQPVSSSSVNWHGSTQSVSVRQPPSSDNALGELKILFPNTHAIYMHDTPSKSFFQKDQRALSHGCVRLADPRRMAAAVLGKSIDDIAKEIAGGRNKGVPVPQKIPVYVAYFTAWPDKDGKVAYFDDVYERDMYTQRAMEATRLARRAQG